MLNKIHLPVSTKTYTMGFVISMALTLLAFGLVQLHMGSGHMAINHHLMVPIILGLAVVQLFVQLVFFLHIGSEQKPRWKQMVFLFATLVVVIIFFGSLWIMTNLNYNMRHMQHTDQQIIEDELLKK